MNSPDAAKLESMKSSIDTLTERTKNYGEGQTRIEDAMISLSDTVGGAMQTIMGVQARAEERHIHDQEFKKEVKEDIAEIKDEFDSFKKDEFQPVRDKQRENSLMIYGALMVVSAAIGALATKFLG